MRINEYKSLDEFICEYDSGRRPSTETQPRPDFITSTSCTANREAVPPPTGLK